MLTQTASGNSLNLAGDGDDVDLLDEIEETFGISIPDHEAHELRTVGDLYDYVCARLMPGPAEPCLAARAFRDLRDSMPEGQRWVRPSTPLTNLAGAQRLVDWCRDVERRTGNLDVLERHWFWALVGLAVLVAPPVAAARSWDAHGPLALIWLSGWALFGLSQIVPARVNAQVVTVADLIRRGMATQYRRFARDGATGNRADIWLTVEAICREVSGHNGPIRRDTTFFAEPWWKEMNNG